MNLWHVGLSSWIIQDGNYQDFHRDQIASFALEFYPHDFRVSKSKSARAERIREDRYRVTAKVVAVVGEACAIDFGLRAYRRIGLPKNVKKGSWIDVDVYLGIDPFFYFEDLAHVRGMPPLIYDWRIRKITMQTAPFLETRNELGQRVLTRDEAKSKFKAIARTNAWEDDEGRAEYVLHCQLLNRRARKRRK